MTATTSATPAASDASAGSSTATNSAPTEGAPSKPQTSQQRMMASIERRRAESAKIAGTASPNGASGQEGAPPDSSPGTADGIDGATAPVDGKKPDEVEVKTRMIPEAAFKARLGEVSSKLSTEREEHATTRLSLDKAKAALQLQQGEIERLKQQLQEGRAYDPRDDEIAERDLASSAREVAERLVREHQEALRQQQEQFLLESKREQVKERIRSQIEDTLPKYPLADWSTVVGALKANPRLSVEEAAKTVHLREAERLERLGYSPRAAAAAASANGAPQGVPAVRAPGSASSSTGRFANNQKGMMDFIANKRALLNNG